MAKWPYNSAAWTHRRRQVLGESASRSSTGRPVCADCGGVANAVDHIVPLSEGGAPFDLDNLRAICRTCNSSRAAKRRAQLARIAIEGRRPAERRKW